MPKVDFVCEMCGEAFQRWPSAVADAEKRGRSIRFCSRACHGAAKTAGLAEGKKRRGKEVTCSVCGTKVYRSPKRIREGRVYLCSEPCRIKAHEAGLIDRSGPRPNMKRGDVVDCRICGKPTYRKKSMIDRRIHMTCGDPKCVSAYGRSLWGLPPLTPEQAKYKKGPARRATNFTAAQRIQFLGSECARCGSTENLCLDHVVPVSAGGQSTFENSQTLCQPCNNWKAKHIDRPMALAYKQAQSGG